jgi:methionyl-tRNA formyltransferase
MRLIFLGMRGVFTSTVLKALLQAGYQPDAVIIPSASPLPGERPSAIRQVAPTALLLLATDTVTMAHMANVPVWEVGRLRVPETLATLHALAPEVLVTACFPRLLPPPWLAAPRLGCLNLHPSLLPAYRGPEPLFWQFRNAEPRTGVTLHFMDERADTGDLVAQAAVPFPDGLRYAEAEALTARAGAELLVAALRRAGQDALPRRPQPTEGVSLAPQPTPSDLTLPTDWPARRAFNFVRGAEPFGPFVIQSNSGALTVKTALEWSAAPPAAPAAEACWVRFADGWVLFTPS